MGVQGVVVNEIDVVDTGRYGHVEHRIHVLAIEGQVLSAEANHTDLQASPAQDSGFHSHPCSPPLYLAAVERSRVERLGHSRCETPG